MEKVSDQRMNTSIQVPEVEFSPLTLQRPLHFSTLGFLIAASPATDGLPPIPSAGEGH